MTNTGIVDLFGNNIVIQLGEETIGQIKVPSDYVAHTFAPILGVHELITGDRLVNGLIVVVEDNMFRRNPNVLSPEYPDRKNGFVPSEYDRASVEEQSRWALVTDLDKSGQIIKFTAIYSDGTMRSRTYNKSIKWAVLKEFEMLPVCRDCNTVHVPGESTLDMDQMTRDVTTQLFGEEMSFDEFSARLKDDSSFIDQIFGGVLDKLVGGIFGSPAEPEEEEVVYPESAEIPADNPRRPDETDDEYADRLRDEAEIAGEYDQNEQARIRQRKLDDEALAALREKLTGQPAVISVVSNEQ